MKNINYIFFDLDGTLLPLTNEDFLKVYYRELAIKLTPTKYDPKLVMAGIDSGLKTMYQDRTERLNEDTFWEGFEKKTSYMKEEVYDIFVDFYSNEFLKLEEVVEDSGYPSKIVSTLNDKGYKLVLATNPLFPMVAQLARAGLVGLEESDFVYVTSMENSTKLKPDHQYFEEIMTKLEIRKEEVLMVGNSVSEDMYAARKAGLRTVLITDYLLNDKDLNEEIFEKHSLVSFYRKFVENNDVISQKL